MSGAGAYQRNSIVSAEPIDLVAMAFHHIFADVAKARECFATNDPQGRGKAITSAWEILAELYRMLDRERGGDIAEQLGRLYDFAMRRLLEAHSGKNPAALDEAEGALTPLAQAWDSLRAHANPSTPVETPTPADGNWSNVAAFSSGGEYARQQWTL
jgi:flagellar protein FliS